MSVLAVILGGALLGLLIVLVIAAMLNPVLRDMERHHNHLR